MVEAVGVAVWRAAIRFLRCEDFREVSRENVSNGLRGANMASQGLPAITSRSLAAAFCFTYSSCRAFTLFFVSERISFFRNRVSSKTL